MNWLMFTVWFRFVRCIGPVRSQCRIPFQTAGGKEAITRIRVSKSRVSAVILADTTIVPICARKKMRDIERSTASLTRGNDDCNGNIVAHYIAAPVSWPAMQTFHRMTGAKMLRSIKTRNSRFLSWLSQYMKRGQADTSGCSFETTLCRQRSWTQDPDPRKDTIENLEDSRSIFVICIIYIYMYTQDNIILKYINK